MGSLIVCINRNQWLSYMSFQMFLSVLFVSCPGNVCLDVYVEGLKLPLVLAPILALILQKSQCFGIGLNCFANTANNR